MPGFLFWIFSNCNQPNALTNQEVNLQSFLIKPWRSVKPGVAHFDDPTSAKSHHNQIWVIKGRATQTIPWSVASHAKNQQKILVEAVTFSGGACDHTCIALISLVFLMVNRKSLGITQAVKLCLQGSRGVVIPQQQIEYEMLFMAL